MLRIRSVGLAVCSDSVSVSVLTAVLDGTCRTSGTISLVAYMKMRWPAQTMHMCIVHQHAITQHLQLQSTATTLWNTCQWQPRQTN